MDADERREKMNEVSERIIGAAFNVHNELGVGFLEKVYENALAYELRKSGHEVAQQHPVKWTPMVGQLLGLIKGEWLERRPVSPFQGWRGRSGCC